MLVLKFFIRLSKILKTLGISEEIGTDQKYGRQHGGTAHFAAPEMLAYKNFDFKADIWSAGVIMFYTLTNDYPYAASRNSWREMNELVNTDAPVPL